MKDLGSPHLRRVGQPEVRRPTWRENVSGCANASCLIASIPLAGLIVVALYFGVHLALPQIVGLLGGPILLGGLLGGVIAAVSFAGIVSIATHPHRPGTTPVQKLFAVAGLALLGLFGGWMLAVVVTQPIGNPGF